MRFRQWDRAFKHHQSKQYYHGNIFLQSVTEITTRFIALEAGSSDRSHGGGERGGWCMSQFPEQEHVYILTESPFLLSK